MDLGSWVYFIISLVLGGILVQISHGKIPYIAKQNINLSIGFLKTIRYLGLFIIIYSCYGVIINFATT